MKKAKINSMLLVLFLVCCQASLAGDMNPPSSPAPTMKTLDEVEPRTPISKDDMPLTIKNPGSYYFTESITWSDAGTGSGNAAIDIQSNSVTIDMMGFSLDGPSTSKCTTGIYSENKQRISIVNGTVKDFTNYCIRLAGESGWYNSVDGIKSENSLILIKLGDRSSAKNCKFYKGTTMSLWVGGNSIVSDCIVRNIPKICADGIRGDWNCVVTNCIVNTVTNTGIAVDENSIVKNCNVKDSDGYGIHVGMYSNVSGCTARGCKNAAINGNSYCMIENCNVSGSTTGIYVGYGCTARGNLVNGNATGIKAMRGTLIEDNQIYEADYGIRVDNYCTVRNNNVAIIYSSGITLDSRRNIIQNNSVVSDGTIRKGICILGDDNLCINNNLSNPINIDNSGTGNKLVDNITF